jgi:hypothetical protein
MAEICLPTVRRNGAARVIGQWIGQWRGRSTSARTIDPSALSDHMQRDLGFRDGCATAKRDADAVVDPLAWR